MDSLCCSTWSVVVISPNSTTNKNMNLKKNRIRFLTWLAAEGADPTSSLFSRAYLRTVAIKNGMAWAPAWIVKDKGRVDSRGFYRVPEYADFMKQNPAIVAVNPAQTAAPVMAGSV
jgi:hypothetical protein